MPYVNVPNDLSKIKTKIAFNLTKRQLICFGIGAASGFYTKTVEYEDSNYAAASTEDQIAIFGGWSSFFNYFDSSLPLQLSFVNRRSRSANRYKMDIPEQEDEFNRIRYEYVEMLQRPDRQEQQRH